MCHTDPFYSFRNRYRWAVGVSNESIGEMGDNDLYSRLRLVDLILD